MPVELVIEPRTRPVGAGEVRRILPFRRRRHVGPFVFLDRIGPDPLPAGRGVDIGAHPHIGLATLTYLFEGSLVHRDGTGAVQRIDPGDVNWMHAGDGVAHSERSPDDARAADITMSGFQAWVALPDDHEDDEPFFTHHPADRLPTVELDGAVCRVLVGSAFGATSPVETVSPMLYAVVDLDAGASVPTPEASEVGVVAVDGDISVDGESLAADHLAVVDAGGATVTAASAARVLLLGGESVGERLIWWNFVASTSDRIELAKKRWVEGLFDPVPDEDEVMPLPGS